MCENHLIGLQLMSFRLLAAGWAEAIGFLSMLFLTYLIKLAVFFGVCLCVFVEKGWINGGDVIFAWEMVFVCILRKLLLIFCLYFFLHILLLSRIDRKTKHTNIEEIFCGLIFFWLFARHFFLLSLFTLNSICISHCYALTQFFFK